MDKRTWQFKPLDTLFFRDGKPIDPGESGFLESVFPPFPSTMQGIIRTCILSKFAENFKFDKNGNWICNGSFIERFKDKNIDLTDQIGRASQSQDIGKLKLSGPFMVHNNQRLYPLPLDIVKTSNKKISFLTPGKVIPCDLGNVRLPRSRDEGVKNFENAYITESDMRKVLYGKEISLDNLQFLLEPEDDTVKPREENILADVENRIGLARNNSTRNCKDGHLYAISPIRLRKEVYIEMDVGGIDSGLHPSETTLQKMGGEGKLVEVSMNPARTPTFFHELAEAINSHGGRFKLVMLTHGKPRKDNEKYDEAWLPRGFEKNKKEGWEGVLKGIRCRLVSACIGKPQKIGGWDMLRRCPKEMLSYVPAGSVYFFKAEKAKGDEIVKALESFRLGKETNLGYGQFLIGTWLGEKNER